MKGSDVLGKIILITGGSRSGKSSYAESLLKSLDDVLYIATAAYSDQEMKQRIKRHKENRNPKWVTYEGYRDLNKVILANTNENIILDCVGAMASNLLYETNQDFDKLTSLDGERVTDNMKLEFKNFIKRARDMDKILVIVTNEIGCSLQPLYTSGRIFTDLLGFVNQYIGNLSDEIYLMACGQPLKIK